MTAPSELPTTPIFDGSRHDGWLVERRCGQIEAVKSGGESLGFHISYEGAAQVLVAGRRPTEATEG